MEKVKEKVNELDERTILNNSLVGELYGDQLRQDSNVVPRLEKLEKKVKLLKLKLELKELKGGEKMDEKTEKPIEFIPEADFNKDGIVSKPEMNLYSFLQGFTRESNQYYRESTANAQANAKWMALGSMAFLALLYILDLIRVSIS